MDADWKALSVRTPWWFAILYMGKDIENRDWPTRFRGPVLLHASKWFDAEEIRDDFAFARQTAEGQGVTVPGPITLGDLRKLGGHIVGKVEIVDCVSSSASPWFFGKHGFVLRNPVAFANPTPVKGALGFFRVPGFSLSEAA